jgi:holin-like protein
MKYIKQFAIIILIAFIGEILNACLPLPIPGSIYGLILLLICLCTGWIKLRHIEETAGFLLDIMPLLFLPAIVRLVTMGTDLKRLLIPLIIAGVPVTILVMGCTGKITDFCLRLKERKNK